MHTRSQAVHALALLTLAGLPAIAQTTQDAKLSNASALANDRYGNAVALSGSLAVVGAPFEDPFFANMGAAYLFRESGGSWSQEARFEMPSGFAANDFFGSAVAAEGDLVAIGAPNSNTALVDDGSVLVYRNDPILGWQLEQKLLAGDPGTGSLFGAAVTINNGVILIGAPGDDAVGSAYVFSYNGSAWTQDAKIAGAGLSAGARFGGSVALNGNTALVGAPLQSGGGVVRVYEENSGLWSNTNTIDPSDDNADDEFGFSVAFDGSNALISAHLQDQDGGLTPNAGAVYIYDAATWTLSAKLDAGPDSSSQANFGFSGDIDGSTAVIGAFQADTTAGIFTGAAYVFRFDGTDWNRDITLAASDAATSDLFGYAVAGADTVVIGAPGAPAGGRNGTAYLFNLPPAGPIDTDGDGITDADEVNIYGTDPNSADTDGDLIDDGDEINIYGTDPTAADSDGDLLTDGEEINTYGTDPLAADTDGDLLTDGEEIDIAAFGGCPDPLLFDTDADGLGDGEEHLLGLDPCDADSDGDGLADGSELDFGTDPFIQDSDGDGLDDGTEVDMAQGSGCPDPTNPDSDGDTLSDGAEATLGTSPCSTDTDGDGVDDATDDQPTIPGVSSGYIEDSLRDLAAYVLSLPLEEFEGPNNNGERGRRTALAVKLYIVARAVACDREDFAHHVIDRFLLPRLDGEPRPTDWMAPGAERDTVYNELLLIDSLLSY